MGKVALALFEPLPALIEDLMPPLVPADWPHGIIPYNVGAHRPAFGFAYWFDAFAAQGNPRRVDAAFDIVGAWHGEQLMPDAPLRLDEPHVFDAPDDM
jgi:hypothetical protein